MTIPSKKNEKEHYYYIPVSVAKIIGTDVATQLMGIVYQQCKNNGEYNFTDEYIAGMIGCSTIGVRTARKKLIEKKLIELKLSKTVNLKTRNFYTLGEAFPKIKKDDFIQLSDKRREAVRKMLVTTKYLDSLLTKTMYGTIDATELITGNVYKLFNHDFSDDKNLMFLDVLSGYYDEVANKNKTFNIHAKISYINKVIEEEINVFGFLVNTVEFFLLSFADESNHGDSVLRYTETIDFKYIESKMDFVLYILLKTEPFKWVREILPNYQSKYIIDNIESFLSKTATPGIDEFYF